jgi:amidase
MPGFPPGLNEPGRLAAPMSDLLFKPAAELAALVRTGQISSAELVGAALERIEALQPSVNAFSHVDAEGALAAAGAIGADDPRPFAGVPIAVKDNVAVAGMPYTMGSDLFGDFVPGHDAFVVRRLRDAGFVIVGRTVMPEFGILPVTEPRRFGPVRNPWDPERTPGGSSGGSAAAVASGMVPLAHGSDGGGSIRIPASCCGLVGLKPTRGRISRGPEQGDDFLVTDGALTRTVAETAQLLDVLSGYEVGDATWAPPPAEPFAAAAKREPGRLRIGFTTKAPIDAPLDPACERAVGDAAELLTELGHEVEEVAAPWGDDDLLELFTLTFGTPVSLGIYFGGLVTGREPSPELVEPLSWTMWEGVRERSSVDYLLARTQLTNVSRGIVALWESHDVVLTPGLAERPVRIGEIDACSDEPWEDFRRSGVFTPYTALFNVTGQPAISLPLFHGDDGLPLSVQLAGRPADEATLLSLSAQLEAARPWANRRPELAAA